MKQSRKHITSNKHCLKRSHEGTKFLKYMYHIKDLVHQEITNMRLTITVRNGWSYSNMKQSRKHITSNKHCLKRSHAGTKLLKYMYHNLFQHN